MMTHVRFVLQILLHFDEKYEPMWVDFVSEKQCVFVQKPVKLHKIQNT